VRVGTELAVGVELLSCYADVEAQEAAELAVSHEAFDTSP
jgi:hypothetical protein